MKNIIFIHGNASSARVFDPIIKDWQLPIKLMAFDLLGHGNSFKTVHYSWNSNKNFLLEQINKVEGDKLLLGNSLGAFYVIELAPMVHSLKGIVLIGSSPLKKPLNFDEAFIPNPHMGTYLKESPNEEELDEAVLATVQNKTLAPLLKEDFYSTETKTRTMLIDWLGEDVFLNQVEIFSTLRCPRYIINGTKDPIVNFNYLKKLQNKAVHPFKLLEIKDCGHYPTIEKPEEFTTILEEISEEVFQ